MSDAPQGPGWWQATDGRWYPPQGYAQPSNAALQPSETSGLAIASLVTGIMGLAPIAVILGHLGLRQIKRSGGRRSGRGLAIAGTVLGYLGLLAVAIVVVAAVLVAVGTSDDSPAAPEETGETVTRVVVPDVVGMTTDDAVATLRAAGLNPVVSEEASDTDPAGTVIRQSPVPATSTRAGADVVIYVSSGP